MIVSNRLGDHIHRQSAKDKTCLVEMPRTVQRIFDRTLELTASVNDRPRCQNSEQRQRGRFGVHDTGILSRRVAHGPPNASTCRGICMTFASELDVARDDIDNV